MIPISSSEGVGFPHKKETKLQLGLVFVFGQQSNSLSSTLVDKIRFGDYSYDSFPNLIGSS